MDDDDTREFSQGIVFGFFEQAQETFKSLKQAMYETAIPYLSLMHDDLIMNPWLHGTLDLP